MMLRFLIITIISLPIFLNAQIQKGSFGVSGNFQILHKKNPDKSPFFNHQQLFVTLPTIDYYVTKRLSIGGSAQFINFSSVNRGGEMRQKLIYLNPHLKFGVNWRRNHFFLSASAVYLKHTVNNIPPITKEFASYLGAGFQLFLTKNIAWENWLQFPFILANDPRFDVDAHYSSGLKFYLNGISDRPMHTELFDYYLDKHNIRIGLNMNGFKYFDTKTSLFDRVDWTYQNFFRDFFVFYLDYKLEKNEDPLISEIGYRIFRFKTGFETYFSLTDDWYILAKTGAAFTNTDYAFSYRLRTSFGVDLGLSLAYFFPEKAVLRAGVDWQNTYAGGFETYYSNVLPYVGWEVFLSPKISIEPRLVGYFYQSEEVFRFSQTFTTVKAKEQNLLFEVKFKTLFYRSHGFFK